MADAAGPFGAPSSAIAIPEARETVRRIVRFVVGRTVRLVTPLMCGLWGSLLAPHEPGIGFAIGFVVGIALWIPPTVALGRVTLQPRPPDRHLLDDEGRPVNEADARLALRAASIENIAATLPLVAVALWLAPAVPAPRPLAILAASVLGVWLVLRSIHWVAVWAVREATLDLAVGDDAAALRRLTFPARLGGWVGDHARHHVAIARFRHGDPEGAIVALDSVRDGGAWQVPTLRAQMRAGVDPAGARRRAAELGDSQRDALARKMLLALADLHEGRGVEVAARATALLDGEPADLRRLLVLLVAAAVAAGDPARADALLVEHDWDRDRIRRLAVGWPALRDVAGNP